MTQKQQQVTEPADLEPVNLDPPDPVLTRWQNLVDRETDICHDGDVSRVIPSPRPPWSEPEEDIVGRHGGSCYMSAPAAVAATMDAARLADDGDTLQTARVVIRAFMGHMFEQDLYGLELKLVRPISGKENSEKPWRHTAVSLTIPEVRELVDILQAAIDLIGDER